MVFGVIQSSANATIDQTNLFTKQVYDVYHSFPESDSIFQITNPGGGFGGMVTKPWSQRKKTTQQLLVESSGHAVEDRRHSRDSTDPAAAAGRRQLPGGLRHRFGGRAASRSASSPNSSCRRPWPAACSFLPIPM